MSATTLGALVSDMLPGVVLQLQPLRLQTRELLLDALCNAHRGNPLRKGFTVTLEKTPVLT